MFDFFRSRDKAVRYLLTGLLAIVALSMVTYLIPGSGQSMGGGLEDETVAKVCDDKITVREVQFTLQAQLKGKQIPPEMMVHFVPEFINQMISERAMACQAGRMGFEITEEDTAKAIRSMLPQLFQAGFNRDQYEAFLAQQGLTIAEFETNVHKQVSLNKLRSLVLEGMIVTPDEVEKEYRRRNEKAKVDYVVIKPDDFRSKVTVTAADTEAYFKANGAGYRIPEKRAFDIVVIEEVKIAEGLQLADADLRKMYEASKERYRTPDRLKIRHILLKTTGKPKDEVAKIEAKANDLLKQIKGGADFGELAKKNSEDPGSAVKGGELDWVTKGQTVANFEKTAFALKPKELSGVITTEYGFHILQLLEREDARLKPFDEVKGALAVEGHKQAVVDRLQLMADKAHTDFVKNPLGGEGIAKQYSGDYYRVDAAGANDPIPGVGLSAELGNAVGLLAKGGVTPVIAVPGNKLVMAALRDIIAARPAQLNEVEAQVKETVIGQKMQEMAKQKEKEIGDRLKAGADLATLAKELGTAVKSTPEFGPDGQAEGIGSAQYLSDAFTRKIGDVIGPISISGQTFVVKLTAKSEADMSKLPPEREGLVTSLKSKKAGERRELFEDGLVQEMIREGKLKRNDAVIKRIVSGFRS